MPMAAIPTEAADIGRLANNFMLVQGLRTSLSRTEMNAATIPKQVIRVIADDAWRAWIDPETGEPRGKGTTADFREFISTPWPDGCGSEVHVLERMIRTTAAWEPYVKATRGTPGAPEGNQFAAKPWVETNRNIVTDSLSACDSPSIIPLSPDTPRPPRNYGRESKQGNSVSYAIRRLERNRPDLLEEVKVGKISPHAAMVTAGFVDKAITIPADPLKASRRLLRHFGGDTLLSLVTELANHAGYDLVPKE